MNKENGKIIVAFVSAVVLLIVSGFIAKGVMATPNGKNAYPIEIAELSVPVVKEAKEDVSLVANDTIIPVEAPSFVSLLADADIKKGKKLSRACAACHSFDKGGKNKIGPVLWGIVDREVAASEGFSYSDAMKDKGGKWGYEELDKFLKKPKEAIKGTKMAFGGMKKIEDRANIVSWLRTLNDNPPLLP